MKNTSISTITKVAILGAVSFILMFFDFSLPIFPSFYKLDFSEIAVLIGGFALGWKQAVAIEALKIVLKLLFTGSQTAYVGEIANFLTGCAFVLPATLIYHNNKTKGNALKGMIVGTISLVIAGIILNYFVLLPAYSYFYKLPMDALIGMGSAIIPLIKDRLTFVLFATSPFNILKGVLICILTTILYKHISPLLHR